MRLSNESDEVIRVPNEDTPITEVCRVEQARLVRGFGHDGLGRPYYVPLFPARPRPVVRRGGVS